MLKENNLLKVGTEVFVLDLANYGKIVNNNNGKYTVMPIGDNNTKIVVDFNNVVELLPIGTKVQIKDTAFCGFILGDDKDLPIENLEGFYYWIGEDFNDDCQKLLVHYEDVCLA